MSSDLATTQQGAKPKTPATAPRLGLKLSSALDEMVFNGLPFDEAARTAGLTTRAMRKALDKPHVIAELRRRKQVFRAHASAANIHSLVDLRDKSGNAMARLGAIRTLENLDEDGPQVGVSRSPGVVIVIGSGTSLTAHERTIDGKPLKNHGSVSETRVITGSSVPFTGEDER